MPAPAYVRRLQRAIREDLRDVGIESSVSTEEVGGGTKLYRLWVVSSRFQQLLHSERQSLVWRTAEDVLTRKESRRISMIITLTPDELGD